MNYEEDQSNSTIEDNLSPEQDDSETKDEEIPNEKLSKAQKKRLAQQDQTITYEYVIDQKDTRIFELKDFIVNSTDSTY